jgi:lysozyme
MRHPRIAITALSLSAAGFAGLVVHEGYTDRALIPVPGDRPTVGFGSTFRDDGSPVRMGDTITPPQAVVRSLNHIQKDETRLKQCVTAPLYQAEYDILVDWSYQHGADAACRSTLVRLINQGQYRAACEQYLRWRFVAGRDCSQPGTACRGVWLRAQDRHAKCMEAQK